MPHPTPSVALSFRDDAREPLRLVSERLQFKRRSVELAGIEPASFGADPGLLRVQFVMTLSQPRRSHEHVVCGLSHEVVPMGPRGQDPPASLLDEARI